MRRARMPPTAALHIVISPRILSIIRSAPLSEPVKARSMPRLSAARRSRGRHPFHPRRAGALPRSGRGGHHRGYRLRRGRLRGARRGPLACVAAQRGQRNRRLRARHAARARARHARPAGRCAHLLRRPADGARDAHRRGRSAHAGSRLCPAARDAHRSLGLRRRRPRHARRAQPAAPARGRSRDAACRSHRTHRHHRDRHRRLHARNCWPTSANCCSRPAPGTSTASPCR